MSKIIQIKIKKIMKLVNLFTYPNFQMKMIFRNNKFIFHGKKLTLKSHFLNTKLSFQDDFSLDNLANFVTTS